MRLSGQVMPKLEKSSTSLNGFESRKSDRLLGRRKMVAVRQVVPRGQAITLEQTRHVNSFFCLLDSLDISYG